MPGMPRPQGKPKKIAFNLLGVPANLKKVSSRNRDRAEKILLYDETKRVR